MAEPAIPLSRWADTELAQLAAATGSARIAALDGATLLGERAAFNGFTIPGLRSAGGGCRLFQTRDGWIALNLARADDRLLLPALFEDDALNPGNNDDIAENVATATGAELVSRGREMGLAIASVGECSSGTAWIVTAGAPRHVPTHAEPLVVDLSALWAGPLATHLFRLAGAEVVKAESRVRPDAMRDGDPALFARLNQGKANVAGDWRDAEDRDALIALLHRADIVVEAARPRALLQLGIDADRIVRETPGLMWLSITGHGVAGAAANWVGFGDDCGVAAGLSAALMRASGRPGFVGDAIADPLTGIMAARLGWQRWRSGEGGRLTLSMAGVVAEALRTAPPTRGELRRWAECEGQPFPAVAVRPAGPIRPLGADNRRWLGETAPC